MWTSLPEADSTNETKEMKDDPEYALKINGLSFWTNYENVLLHIGEEFQPTQCVPNLYGLCFQGMPMYNFASVSYTSYFFTEMDHFFLWEITLLGCHTLDLLPSSTDGLSLRSKMVHPWGRRLSTQLSRRLIEYRQRTIPWHPGKDGSILCFTGYI